MPPRNYSKMFSYLKWKQLLSQFKSNQKYLNLNQNTYQFCRNTIETDFLRRTNAFIWKCRLGITWEMFSYLKWKQLLSQFKSNQKYLNLNQNTYQFCRNTIETDFLRRTNAFIWKCRLGITWKMISNLKWKQLLSQFKSNQK